MNVNMASSDENNPGLIEPLKNTHGGLAGANGMFVSGNGHNRRALSNINWNIIRDPDATKKYGLTDFIKQRVCNKDLLPPIPVHRPITRKFAAEMAKQSSHEELMNHGKLIQNPTHTEDVNIIDVEDSEEDDFSAPMYVQQTEAMLEEIDRMDEVEMEDMEQVVDIDSNDKKDPLAVVEYIDELYAYYKKSEGCNCVPPSYMIQQSDINERMRGILIDWLIEVHYKFELMDETLYLTVNLIDRFLAIKPIVRKKLQLVGVTAMLLACKYEEVSVPIVEDFILISDKAYIRKEVLEMEKLMVNALQFNFSVPTPYVFMRRFLKAAQSDKKLELVSSFLIELCLVEYEMLKFPPSLLAAGAIFTAQCTIGGFKQWSKTSEWYSGYSEEQLLDCSRLMVSFHQKAGSGKLTGVHRKYSTSKYGYAARIKPATFLLDTRFFI